MITRQHTNWVAFLLLVIIVIFTSYHPAMGIKGYESNTLVISLSLLFLLLSFFSSSAQRIERYPVSYIATSLIIFLVWSAFGYFYTVDQDNSLSSILLNISGIVLLIGLILNIKEEEYLIKFLWVALFCAGLMGLIAILQQFQISSFLIPENLSTLKMKMSTGLYGHKNALATYLLLHFPLSVYFLFYSESNNKKSLAGVLSILILLGLIFSKSRGGQLVLIIQITSILAYFYIKKDYSKILGLFVGIGLTMGILLSINFFTNIYIGFYNAAGDRVDPDIVTKFIYGGLITGESNAWANLENRIKFWTIGWEIFKDYWLTGTGPWTFELLFPKYLADSMLSLVAWSSILQHPPHSHNIFVQTAIDSGVIGLGLLLTFLIVIFFRGINLVRNAHPKVKNFAFFLILSITSFMIHNQIEYNWIQINFIYPFIYFVFALDFLDRKYNPINNYEKIINPLISSYILLTFTIWGALGAINYYKYQTILYEKIITGTDVVNMRLLTNKAKTYCPSCGWPHLEMAKTLISQYRINPEPVTLVTAEKELQEAKLLIPFNPTQFIYLAEVRSFQKNFDEAKELYVQAFTHIKMKRLALCRVASVNPDKC
jgi:O-antigen ligase